MCFLTSQDVLACICILYLANQYSMHVALVVYPCLADAIFFEWWSTSALAFDLLDFITWRVSLLPHATTNTMQMALVKMPISYISSTMIRPGEVMKSKYRIILHLVDDLPMDDYADIFLEPSVSRHQADLLIRNQIYRYQPSWCDRNILSKISDLWRPFDQEYYKADRKFG